MREDHFDVDERKEEASRKSGSTDLLARLILYHPEHAPDHLRPKPPPKPEPEPISPEPAPIPDITITDELLRSVTVRAIQNFVCREYNISREKLCSTRRYGELTTARYIAMYLASELTKHSWPLLGRLFCRNHSSIYNAVKLMDQRRARDQALHNRISVLQSRLLAEISPEPLT